MNYMNVMDGHGIELEFNGEDESLSEELDSDLSESEDKPLTEPFVGSSEDTDKQIERKTKRKGNDRQKKKRKKIKDNRKGERSEATAQELNDLRDTESLFHSSLFRLQLSEMLSEVRVKEKTLNLMDKWLKQFESLLRSLKSSPTYDLTDQLWCKTVKVPIIQEPFAVSGKFCFKAPEVCRLIGSYDLGTAIGAQTLVDMAVQMPVQCWQRHDNLNHKYQRKRALYLSHISQSIKSNEMIGSVEFTYFKGNHTKPILLIAPNGKLAKHFRLALTAYPERDEKVFRLTRFTPEKNNIRANWLQMSAEDVATPSYNSSVQHDLNLVSNYEYLSAIVKDCSPVKDSLILLKIWLKQRDMKSEFGFILSLFVCHLLEKHRISRNQSCYQIFRNTLLSIANSRWDTEGIALALSEHLWRPLDYYLTYFAVVFIDVSGYHNLCWDISVDSYDRLRHESRLTVDCLDSNQKNSFESTFMKEIRFEAKYDVLFHISVPSLLKSSKVSDISSDIIDNCGDTVTAFVAHLVPLCRRVVGQRVLLLEHKSRAQNRIEWASDQLPPHPNDTPFLTFGLIINAENAYNNIERGPAADSPEAQQFKEFWGEKSELRRFQDNSICETVYWNTKTFAQKRQIITKSLEFILTNILNIPLDSIFTTISLLDPMLELPNLSFEDKNIDYGTGEEIGLSICHKFDGLAKKLRALEGLPLTVTTVQGIDSVFRATDVFPPVAMNSGKAKEFENNCNIFDVSAEQRVAKHFRPLEVIIQLEGSGKWPNDLDAFNRVKASFNVELGRRLSAQFGLICYYNADYVDVLDDGLVFRIMIGSHKEVVLLRQMKTTEGLVKQVESRVADDLETKYEIIPKINSALNALNRTNACYGTTSRLAKRWIASQMLSFYLDDMAIDLMVAHLFVSPNPYTVPNSPIVGFLRFVSLICEQNWKISPLIVHLNGVLNEEMETEINAKFTAKRADYPPMFITSSYDKLWSKWTDHWPDSVILNRLIVLANAAKQTLLAQMTNPLNSDPEMIFRPDLDVYDMIVRLHSDQITNQIQAIDFPKRYQLLIKQFDPELNQRMPIIDFDPIKQFLRYLRTNYSDFGLFFYDRFGGRQIGIVWKPSVFASKAFNTSELKGILLASSADPNGRQNTVTNIEAIIEDICIVGEGIVASVDLKHENWVQKSQQ